MFEMFEVCGKCRYHKVDDGCKDFSCDNEDSERYGEFTEYNEACEYWEGKDDE